MKRVFVIILAIAAAAMGCRAQEVVEINSTRQAVKRTGDALLGYAAGYADGCDCGARLAGFEAGCVFNGHHSRSVVSVEVYGAQDAPRPQ